MPDHFTFDQTNWIKPTRAFFGIDIVITKQASQMCRHYEVMSSDYINIVALHRRTNLQQTHTRHPCGATYWGNPPLLLSRWTCQQGEGCYECVCVSLGNKNLFTHPCVLVVWLDDSCVPLSGAFCAIHLHTVPNQHRRCLQQDLLTSLVLQPMIGCTDSLLTHWTLVTHSFLLVKPSNGIRNLHI